MRYRLLVRSKEGYLGYYWATWTSGEYEDLLQEVQEHHFEPGTWKIVSEIEWANMELFQRFTS